MKYRKLFLILIPLVLLFACGAPAAVTTATQPVASTPLPGTAVPSVPPTAAATDFPPLAAAGPYFAYLGNAGGQIDLVLLDADGPGRKVIPLPAQVADPDPENSLATMRISPDGKWLAFYAGSGGSCNDPASVPASNDLSLNLVDLSTGQASLVAHLLPANYPQNFAANAQALIASGADTGGLDADSATPALEAAFLCGIRSAAWSPDGRTLAFAGAMDGPSSDTYLYDTGNQKITRLSSGPEEVQWLSWSPDGAWIMQGSTWALGEGMSYNIHASSIDGKTVKTLSNSTSGIVTWLDGHTFLEYDSANGPGDHSLRAVDVQTGEVRSLWKASFASYALDAIHGVLAVSGIPDPSTWTGSLYLIKTASGAQTRIREGVWSIEAYPVAGQSFFVREQPAGGAPGNAYLLSADGLLFPTEIQFGRLSTAPDGKAWVSLEENQLLIYSPTGARLHTVELPVGAGDTSDELTWRPDGSGLLIGFYTGEPFSVSSYSLVSVDVAAGTAVLLDQSPRRLSTPVLVSGGR
jgi:hypothetical protein